MSFFSTTYLLPGILLNPAFVLHLLNTLCSHLSPPPLTLSTSPHPIFESLGPLPGSEWAFDVHKDNALCWRYTAFMVIIQMWIFGRVSGNRISMKDAKAARADRERVRRERSVAREAKRLAAKSTSGFDGTYESESRDFEMSLLVGRHYEVTTPIDESTTETSEEEVIVL
ncbi:hypothetical protein MFRU_063g00350 [Monilinia fructicola]|nr:hypothetical protein MFRU_063g00350 [Monilinia fructicola]